MTGFEIIKTDFNNDVKKVISNSIGLSHASIHNDTLYIGKADGLFKLIKDSLERVKGEHKILKHGITSFFKTKKHLVVGTNGNGVYLYNDGIVIHLKNTAYLLILRAIVDENDLWLATGKGVLKIRLDYADLGNSKITDRFYESDGLLQNNINDIYIENNLLYVATDLGLAKIDTKSAIYTKTPKLLFNTKKDTVIYSPNESKNINVSFGVLDFTNQENFTYHYRLLPLQQDWTVSKTQTLNFTSLSPNFYALEVKVTDQHFNENTKNHYFRVLPYWWQTNWAKLIIILSSIFCVGLVFYIIFKRFQKKERLKSQQEKVVSGLELQALRSQMNPHFVHNSLNAIQYYIQRNEVDLSEEYLEKFSKLIRMFFDYAQKQYISLDNEINLLQNYLEIEQLRFENKLFFEINIDERINTELQMIPAMLLQPIVENAVNHGIFHKLTKGNITISFSFIAEKEYKVMIEDDGIGTIKAAKIYKNSKRNYQSKSSEVLKERLRLLEKNNNWTIDYKIEDLSVNNSGNGTLVTLKFLEN